MYYKKLSEVHEDALYSIHTEISSEVFNPPYDQNQSITWIVHERKFTKREYSPFWLTDCELNIDGVPKNVDMYEDILINEMFDQRELEIMMNILKNLKCIKKLTIHKYNIPLEKYKYPSMSNGAVFFHNVNGESDWFNLSNLIPQTEISELFNDKGIVILGIMRLKQFEAK